MNSMLQELDNSLISKDSLIHEQNGKLAEKDKIIQSNTSEIECLKKGTKMQEYKVMDKIISDCWFVDVYFRFLNVPRCSILDQHPAENDQNLWGW